MCTIRSIPENKTPVQMSNDELSFLWGEIARNHHHKYLTALLQADFVPHGAIEELHHGIAITMQRRQLH